MTLDAAIAKLGKLAKLSSSASACHYGSWRWSSGSYLGGIVSGRR